jgi:hypothetical protein
LDKLLSFLNSKVGEKYEKKYQTSKDCGNLISKFVEQNKDKLVIGSYFIKIKELYSILEMCENFDQVFEYLKKRLIAIKSIHEQSDQFKSLVLNLERSFKTSNDKYQKVLKLLDETNTALEEYYSILEEFNQLETDIKAKYLV